MMKKEHYLSPSTCSFIELEMENSILGSSKIDYRVVIDPVDEHYYDGTEETSDYLIDF
jgi:hypothetical protein